MKDSFCQWTHIPHSEIIVDLTAGGDEGFHAAIRQALGFPMYYGKNWDAYWDLIGEFCAAYPEGRTVVFCGMESLSERDAKLLAITSAEAEEKYPQIHFVFASESAAPQEDPLT